MSHEPKEKDEINQHIEQFKRNKEQSEANLKNYSRASESKILSPEEEEREATRKKQILQGMIQEEIQKSMIEINAQLQQIPTIINQSIQNIIAQHQNQPQPQEQLTPHGDNQQMPPGAALAAIQPEILTGIAQLIQAWKGSSQQQQPDQFGEMFKQLGINIMQAGVDGIYKNVYDGYQPQPRNTQLQAGNLQPQNPNQNRSTGFV